MDIEYNEQRVRDMEIPLHQLEQKMDVIEAKMEHWNVDNISTQVCNKINKTMKASLPYIWSEIEMLKQQLEQLKMVQGDR